MNLTHISKLKEIDLFGLLVLFIPHSIILGNYVLNLNIAIIILCGIFKFYKKILAEFYSYKYFFFKHSINYIKRCFGFNKTHIIICIIIFLAI